MASNDFDQMMADDQANAQLRADPPAPTQVPMAPAAEVPPTQGVEGTTVTQGINSGPALRQLEGGDFDAMMQQDKAKEYTQAKALFQGSEDQDPDRAGKVYNLSQRIGTDPSFVDRNFDALNKGLAVGEIDYAKLARLHPSIVKLANDPVKAAAIRDQVTNLSGFDNAVKDHTFFEDAINTVGYGTAKLLADASKIPAAMYDVASMKENAMRWMRGDKTRITSDNTPFGRNNLVTMTLEEMAEDFKKQLPILNEDVHGAFLKNVNSAANASLPERMYDAVTQGDYVRGGQVLFAHTAAFAPSLLAMIGLSMVNPAAGPAMFAGTTLGERNAQNLGEGMDPLVGTPNAMAHGAIAGYFSQFGINAYLSTLTGRLTAKFGPEVTGQVMKSFGASLVKATGAEAGTMAGMSLADDFADYAMRTNPDALQGSIGRAFDAGLMGAVMGASSHVTGESIVKAHEMRRAEATRDFIQNLVTMSKDNKLRDRSPELHSEFVRESLAGSDAENVQISPEAVETYFQSKGVNPVKAMQDLGFLDQFGHAKETGTNMTIPTAKFIDAVVKNGHDDLVNDIKVSEEDMSVNELNARAELEKSFNKVDDEGIRQNEMPATPGLDRRGLTPDQSAEVQTEQIRKEYARQLTDAGADPAQAQILSELYRVAAERTGVSPLELYKRYSLNITGEGGPEGQGTTFNQEAVNGLAQTLSEAGPVGGERQGDGGRQGALRAEVSSGAEKLRGLPRESTGGVAGVRERARAYVESRGREYRPQSEYVRVDPERAARIADEYERMEHRPNDPDVVASYNALIEETLDQFQSLKESGLKIEAIKPGQENPYPNGSADVFKDIESGHLWFFPTDQGFGTNEAAGDNPLLRETAETLDDGTKLKANDVFRIVHDYFGHAKEGVGFGARGEENAWQSHVRMYSDLAARAMTTETRGQNSWVNYGPYGDANRANPANTRFADQKTGLLPEWVTIEGKDQGKRTLFQTDLPKPLVDPLGFFSQVDAELGKMDFKAMPAKDLLNRIKNIQGIKKEELEALGLEDYLNLRAEEGAKVTKDEVQQFVRDNGPKIEQVVLSTDYKPETKTSGLSRWELRELSENGELTTDHIDWEEPERDRDNDYYDIESELEYYSSSDADDYFEDNKNEFYAENREEYTDDDGEVDEAGLDAAWEKKREELAEEAARASVDSDDYHGARYIVTERATNTHIYGSDEYGWADREGNDLGSNLNEAQIQHVANLADNGDISYPADPDDEDTVAEPSSQGVNQVTGRAKFDRYAVDGAKNYREVLLKLPDNREGGDFEYRAHFNEKNILAHVRISDRVDANGKKVLFLEELQSDWHQQGRERGYNNQETKDRIEQIEAKKRDLDARYDAIRDGMEGGRDRFPAIEDLDESHSDATPDLVQLSKAYLEAHDERLNLEKAVPDAPYKQTDAWAALALKRMLRMAVEEGYDSLAWTPADVHVDRWGTDDVTWVKTPERYRLKFVDPEVQARAERAARKDGVPNKVFTDKAELEEFMSHGSRRDALQVITEPAGFLVGSVEQRGGRAGGVNIEDLARHRGELLERNGERVTSKEELRRVIGDTLGRERDDRSLDSLTDRVWKQMESGDPSGALQPRAEGMKFFYDKVIPDTMKKLLKKIDPAAKIEVGRIETDGQPLYAARGRGGPFGSIVGYIEGPRDRVVETGFPSLEAADERAAKLNAEHPPGMDALQIKLTDQMKKVVGEQGFSLFQNEDGTKRGQITFGAKSIDIKLLEKANRSTFIHEAGHFMLEMMGDLAKTEGAPEQIRSDYQTILQAIGNDGKEPITREQHETHARMVEEYFMEGKAPSAKLQPLFARIKTWMVDIYKTLLNNGVQLSDEVRAVFDRMIATDEEIEHARSVQEIKPLFTEGTMSKARFERYQKAFEMSKLAAENELRAQVMEDIRKEETDLYKRELEETVQRVTEQAKKMPVYQALSILQTGKTIDDGPLPEGVKDIKIDRATLVKEYGKDIIQKLPKPVIYARDGMHPDIVADLLGYESGKQMIEEFAQTPKMSEYIERAAKADMDAKDPKLFGSTYTEDLAMQAIHNDERANVLRMELDHLRELAPAVDRDIQQQLMKRPLPDRQMREQMEAVVGKQNVADLSPNKYRVAERQAAAAAGVAYSKGDIQAAFDAKTRELKNYHLYKAAQEAKAQVDKDLKFFKKLGQSDEKLAKTRDVNLVNTARAVLASYGIGKTDASPMSYLEKMHAYDPDAFNAAAYHVHAATDGGTAENYKQIPYGKFATMSESVKALYQLARDSKEVEIGGKKMAKDAVVNDLVAQLTNHGDINAPKPGVAKAITWRESTKMTMMGIKASLRRVEHWAHAIDGDDYGGVTVKNLVEPIKEAETTLHLKKNEMMKHYLEKVVQPSKDVFAKKPIEAPEIGYTFENKSELLGALMHTGNESNLSKLLRGRGWGDVLEDGSVDKSKWNQVVDRLQKDGTLTKADYDYVQGVWDMYEGLKGDAQKAHFKLYGYHFNEITAEPFQTPFGEYKGGYAPAVADPNISEDAALRREKEAFNNKQDMMMMPTTGRGFTKSRIEAYAAPLALDLRYIPMQIDKVLRFTYMEPAVRDASKLVLDRRYANALGAIDSQARSEMLVPWLQRAASQATTTPSGTGRGYKAMDNFFRAMRSRTGLNAMVGNVINAFHQTTGFSVAAALVEPKYIRDATIRYTRQAAQVTADMHEKSEYMRAKEGQIGELQDELEKIMEGPSRVEETVNWIKKNGYFLQKFTAGMTEAVTWTGAYDKAVAEGKTEKEAVAFGDSVVRRTQHSASPTDVARFGTGNPMQRLFTMYFDYFNNKANLNLTQGGNIGREFGLKKGLAYMAPLYAATMMIPALMTKSAYKVAQAKLDENDDGQYMDDVLKLFFHSQVDEALTAVPFGTAVVGTLQQTFDDNTNNDRLTFSPAFEQMVRAVQTPRHVSDALQGRGRPSKAIKDVFSLLGLMSGLPIQPLSRPIGYAADVASGKAESMGPLDYARGLVTGYGPRR